MTATLLSIESTIDARPFVCEWERPDSPTAGMNDTELRGYYKAHSVRGDCAFSLRDGSMVPADLQAVWAALAMSLDAGRKETPADRSLVAHLRTAYRVFVSGDAYQVPAVPVFAPLRGKRMAAPGCVNCPHCGKPVSAAA